MENPWNILICDDDDDIIQLLSHALKDFSFLNRSANIITCHSEAEARDYIKENQNIHLFYVDIKMEHEDSGFRILRFVREAMNITDSRFIMITGDIVDELAQMALQEFEINEILIKKRMTSLSIYSCALTSLRAFKTILDIRELQSRLKNQLDSFSKFVPELIAPKSITEKDSYLYLGKSREQQMSVLFCDIRNFVSLTESFTSSECFNFINSYLKTVIPSVIKYGGTVYQILGDGILALFPPAKSGYCDNGLEAAIDIQKVIKAYNAGRQKAGYAEVHVGIGLAYGDVALGVSGTAIQMAASAFGRTVNLASRLQDMTKNLKAEILLSKAVVENLSDLSQYHLRFIGELYLKGFSQKEIIFENYDSNEEDVIIEKESHQKELSEAFSLLKMEEINDARLKITNLLLRSKRDVLPQSILRYLDDPQSHYYQKI